MRAAAATAIRAAEAIRRCRLLAGCTEEPGVTTRTFLSPPMRAVHAHITGWMTAAGMEVRVDAAGNIRGTYPGDAHSPARLIVGSHLDTVPHAGAFDGVLGVMLGIALVDSLEGRRLPLGIEVVGFSEEEGVRFGVPFIGSHALAGSLGGDILGRTDSRGRTVSEAIRSYGLDPGGLPAAAIQNEAAAYLEFHIEQGPMLDWLGLPLGVVDTIVGQSRLGVTFTGMANHAGTTPMDGRRDAVTGAAEWILGVERMACEVVGLVATVGQVDPSPGAGNVIAGTCTASLDVRHPDDLVRDGAVARLLDDARAVAARRGLTLSYETRLTQPATPMDAVMTARLARALADIGTPVHRMTSGAGHDAMVMARRMPAAMLFLRSPGGISHHPDEAVLEGDVAAALAAGLRYLDLAAAASS